MSAFILGLGHELPPTSTVGGAQRPIVAEACGPSELALAASGPALAEAGWSVESVQAIVFATMTPDVTFPGAGCFLQERLGAGTVAAMDVRGQCAGYVMGLAIAGDLVECGKYQHVLLASAEVHSSGFDPSPAGLPISSLYGDGGAVTAIGAGSGIAEITAVMFGSDGRHHDRFWTEFPSSRRYPTRITVDDLEAGGHYLKIDREHVSQFGERKLAETVRETLQAGQVAIDDVDLFILSHVFPEVVEAAARELALGSDRVVNAGAERGHLTAASLPVALNLARTSGRIGSGARVCLATCGAGYAWGSALLEFA